MTARWTGTIAFLIFITFLLGSCTSTAQTETPPPTAVAQLITPITAGLDQGIPAATVANHKVMVVFLKLAAPFCTTPENCLPDFPQALQDEIRWPRHPASTYENLLNGTLAAFMREATFSNEIFTFEAVLNPASTNGWFDAPHPLEDYNQSLNASMGVDAYNLAATVNSELVQNYDVLLVITNIQTLYGYTTGLNGRPLVVIGENPDDTSIYEVLAHEFGHVLTLEHVTMGPYDIVGNSQVLNHYGGWSKVYAGWVPQITDLDCNGDPCEVTTWLDPIERAGNNVLRIPIFNPGSIFIGYFVECRAKIGFDANIPEEGVIITNVNNNINPKMSAWIAFPSGDDDYNNAALAPGESFVNPDQEITITYLQKDGSNRCQVKAMRGEIEAPDPLITQGSTDDTGAGYSKYASKDIWIDSLQNGWDVYPPGTGFSSTGGQILVEGYGDPPWANHENRIKFLIRNNGYSDAENVLVDVYVTQPIMLYIPGVTCDGPELNSANLLATIAIDTLANGEVYLGEVPWTPTSNASAQVTIVIRDYVGEITHSNNSASETYIRQNIDIGSIANSAGQLPAMETLNFFGQPNTLTAQASLRCMERIPYKFTRRVISAIDRKDWVMDPTPLEGLLNPGETVEIPLAGMPPLDAKPGDCEHVELAFHAWYDDIFVPFSGLTYRSCVVEPALLTCTAPAESSEAGSSVETGGQLTPAEGGEPIAIEYTNPLGEHLIQLVNAGLDGSYTNSIVADQTGTWQMQAFRQGTDTSAPAESMVCEFQVENISPELLITGDTYCRSGPGTAYPIVAYAVAGNVMPVSARSRDGIWLYGSLNGINCWAYKELGELNVDVWSLPEREAPPLPGPTATPTGANPICSTYTDEAACNNHKNICTWQEPTPLGGGVCVSR